MAASLKSLVAKLNDTTRHTLEAAAGLCVARTHYNVEVEHFLARLVENTDDDSVRIFRRFGIDPSRLADELSRALDKMKRGNARTPAFSPDLVEMFSEAWTLGSLEYGARSVRTAYCLLALTQLQNLWRAAREASRELGRIDPAALRAELMGIVAGSTEEEYAEEPAAGAAGGSAAAGAPAKTGGKTPNLDQFTVNLTEQAKSAKLDPVLGRDSEIRQVIDILMRRRQNNPIMTGEAGVGKTAVVEGFAQKIVRGEVPPPLRSVAVRTLDLALLQAGAGVKGEFENRLKGLIEEVKSSPQPIILFIDEAHNMIGAGGQAGQGDAANLLKPALARGELRTVAATTWSEYKKFFEKDPALARRFQVVKVEEPGEEQCSMMLRGVASSLERHHKVRILDEAVNAAVRLSHRYMAGRQLPDKAVSVLDTACARLALGQNSTPPAIEDAVRELDDLAVQQRVLEREAAAGGDHAERLASIAERRQVVEAELAKLKERFEKEAALVAQVRELREKLEAGAAQPASLAPPAQAPAAAPPVEAAAPVVEVALAAPAAAPEAAAVPVVPTAPEAPVQALPEAPKLPTLREQLDQRAAELAALQGAEPLMRVCVDEQVVSEVISNWTGIPVGKMLKDEIETTLNLPKLLGGRVIGQDHALEVISQRIRTAKARLDDPNRPIGVFLLVGPSGVGKTETALALADLFYGGEKSLITINMSEFQEAHTVSTLKGSPPGYVGYGEGGVLTEAVRRRPYSVVLLDEVEKAHPDVLELFYQVFDKGNMEDGEGREIDFKNTIILLTSNAATETFMKLVADPETMPSPLGLVKALKPELDKVFKPAFLGRLVIIPYYPIRDEAMKTIIRLKLGRIQKRIAENHRIALGYDEALVNAIAQRCTEVESGARNIDNILTNTLLPDISRQLLTEMAEGRKVSSFQVGLGDDGKFTYATA